jgi:hypothetical protein
MDEKIKACEFRPTPRTIIGLTPRAAELNDAFHLETGRVIGNHWVVRHDNPYFQVKAQSRLYGPAKAKVMVCEWENGKLEIRFAAARWRRTRSRRLFQLGK